ncbi:hypothetical protein FKM82_019018 [Ascaphus truei]
MKNPIDFNWAIPAFITSFRIRALVLNCYAGAARRPDSSLILRWGRICARTRSRRSMSGVWCFGIARPGVNRCSNTCRYRY